MVALRRADFVVSIDPSITRNPLGDEGLEVGVSLGHYVNTGEDQMGTAGDLPAAEAPQRRGRRRRLERRAKGTAAIEPCVVACVRGRAGIYFLRATPGGSKLVDAWWALAGDKPYTQRWTEQEGLVLHLQAQVRAVHAVHAVRRRPSPGISGPSQRLARRSRTFFCFQSSQSVLSRACSVLMDRCRWVAPAEGQRHGGRGGARDPPVWRRHLAGAAHAGALPGGLQPRHQQAARGEQVVFVGFASVWAPR